MKREILSVVIFILLLPLIARAEEISLTLDEAVSIALRDNRDILLKGEDLNKAKLKIAEAQAGLLPTLTFTGGWTRTQGYYGKDLGQTTTQATLKQYLYKGGSIVNTIKYNKDNLRVTQAILDKTRLEIVLNVKKAFFTLLLANDFANLNREILVNTREHLEATRLRYEQGQVSESDILKIKQSQAVVEEAYAASLNQVESARAILNNLLYLDGAVQIKPKGEFIYEPREIAYDASFLTAMRTRPEIRQYEAQEEANKKAIEITKAGTRPSISAAWDYYSRSHLAATSTKNWNDYNVIGLTFSWPIFDGWATKAKVEQAIVDLKEARLLKEKTVKDIALELKNAYLDLKDSLAEIKYTQEQLNLYRDTLLVNQEKYKAGQASSLDLNDAVLGTLVSLFNQKEAIYDYVLAKARFDKATGGL